MDTGICGAQKSDVRPAAQPAQVEGLRTGYERRRTLRNMVLLTTTSIGETHDMVINFQLPDQ